MGWSYSFKVDAAKADTLEAQVQAGLAGAILKAEAEGEHLDAEAIEEERRQIEIAGKAAAVLAAGVGPGWATITLTGHANPGHERPDPNKNSRRYAEGDTITVVVTR